MISTHPGDVLAAAGLVVIDVDPLQLEVRLALVGARGVDPVLVAGEGVRKGAKRGQIIPQNDQDGDRKVLTPI